MARVMCKFCEAQSASQTFTHEPVSFYFPINTKKCTPSIDIIINMYAKVINYHLKVEKNDFNFPSRNQWHSLENNCHSFLTLHHRRMPWEFKYLKLFLLQSS